MTARRALALLVLVLALAGCGGGGPQTLMDVLEDEGYGAARNVQCGEFDSSLGTCTVDFPVGQDVFRDRYSVTLVGKRCWRARQIELERLTGRDSDALALPRHLEGCFDE